MRLAIIMTNLDQPAEYPYIHGSGITYLLPELVLENSFGEHWTVHCQNLFLVEAEIM